MASTSVTQKRPPQMTEAQVAPVNEWIQRCTVRWIECATVQEAVELEDDLKSEWRPPLTKR